ncbi:hypothetical protein B7494_g6543 [Chlorociboria aeruginascens]|nr:hypothetical protein B7494_g6543 [Chlorociboria aeruginascens]
MDAPKNPELKVHEDFDEISLHSDASYEIMQEKPADISEREVKASSRASDYALEKAYPVIVPPSSKPVKDNASTAARKRVWLKKASMETSESDDLDAKSILSIHSEFEEDEDWISVKERQTNQVVEDFENKIKSLQKEIEGLKIQDAERNLRERSAKQTLEEVRAQNAILTAIYNGQNYVKKPATTLEQVMQGQSHDSATIMKRHRIKGVKDKVVQTNDTSLKAQESLTEMSRKQNEQIEKMLREQQEANKSNVKEHEDTSTRERLLAAEATIDDLRLQNEVLKLAEAKEQGLPFFSKNELVVSWDLERREIEVLKNKLQKMRSDSAVCEKLRRALKASREDKEANNSFLEEKYDALMSRYRTSEEERQKLVQVLQEETKASAGQASAIATLKNAGNTLANQNDRINLEIHTLYNLNARLAKERNDAVYDASKQTRKAHNAEENCRGNLQLVRDQLDRARAENENLKIIQEQLLHERREAQDDMSIVSNGPYPLVTRLANGVVVRITETLEDSEDDCW